MKELFRLGVLTTLAPASRPEDKMSQRYFLHLGNSNTYKQTSGLVSPVM